MSTHTPGPWTWTKGVFYDEYNVWICLDASGNPLKVMGRSSRAKSNRALIAAAPDLLSALIDARKHAALFCAATDDVSAAVFEVCDAAIAKARGGAA